MTLRPPPLLLYILLPRSTLPPPLPTTTTMTCRLQAAIEVTRSTFFHFFTTKIASESKAQMVNSTSFVALWAFLGSTTSLYPSPIGKPTAPTPTLPLASVTISLLLLLLLLLRSLNQLKPALVDLVFAGFSFYFWVQFLLGFVVLVVLAKFSFNFFFFMRVFNFFIFVRINKLFFLIQRLTWKATWTQGVLF